MVQVIGIALWALIPGFIAKKKGRNFWGYYFLSFLISPLFAMIITFCLTNLNKTEAVESTYVNGENADSSKNDIVRYCRKCGNALPERARFCNKCGTEVIENVPLLAEENNKESE